MQFQDADEILRKLSRELQHDPDSSDVQRYDVALERAMSCLLLGRVDQAKGHLGLDTSPPTGGSSWRNLGVRVDGFGLTRG